MKSTIPLLLFLLSVPALFSQESGKPRTWTNAAGREVEATLVHATETSAYLKTAKGAVSKIPLASLSGPDQNLIAELLDAKMVLPPLPASVDGTGKAEKFSVKEKTDLGADFQTRLGTILAVAEALPIELAPSAGGPDDKFEIYHIDSAGYSSSLSNSNLRPTAAFLRKPKVVYLNYLTIRGDKLTPTKQAEIDHAVAALTLKRLSDALPAWLFDGVAGNIASFPATRTTVSLADPKTAMTSFLQTRWEQNLRDDIVATHPAKLFGTDTEAWEPTRENRLGAFFTAYYFLHLDTGAAPGVLLAQALDSAGNIKIVTPEEKEELRVAYNAAIEKFNKEVAEFRERNAAYNQRVIQYNKQLADKIPEADRIKVGDPPKQPKRPEMPGPLKPDGGASAAAATVDAEKIEAKLLKGRPPEQIAQQIRAMFSGLGVPIEWQ